MPTYEVVGKKIATFVADKVQQRKIKAILPWKLTSLEKSKDGTYKMGKLTGNAVFPIPWPIIFKTLTDLSDAIDDLDDAIAASARKEEGSAEIEKAATLRLYNILLNIMTMVQLAMDTKPLMAIQICEGAGFKYKSQGTRGPRKNSANKGNEPGVMLLEGEGAGHHQWQQSPDKGETFTDLSPTSNGETTVTGLITDKRYWFRTRLVLTKGRYGDWSAWFSETAP